MFHIGTKFSRILFQKCNLLDRTHFYVKGLRTVEIQIDKLSISLPRARVWTCIYVGQAAAGKKTLPTYKSVSTR